MLTDYDSIIEAQTCHKTSVANTSSWYSALQAISLSLPSNYESVIKPELNTLITDKSLEPLEPSQESETLDCCETPEIANSSYHQLDNTESYQALACKLSKIQNPRQCYSSLDRPSEGKGRISKMMKHLKAQEKKAKQLIKEKNEMNIKIDNLNFVADNL